MSTAVKRACDACHRRKVKCDGVNPCRNCSSAQLTCTYNAIPQKKGPKGSRAKVISELRETQRQTSLSARVQNKLHGVNSPPTIPSLAPTPGLLTPDLLKESIEFYFTNMYSIMPILDRQRLQNQALFMDQSLDNYCLMTSLCAFMMFQPGMNIPGVDPFAFGANIMSGTMLIDETIRVRKGYDHLESPSLNTLCTSYLLFASYHSMELYDKAWYHLREATTLAFMLGMNNEDSYRNYDQIDGSRRRRLYWLLFMAERAFAFKFQRPISLQATINPPSLTDDPNDPQAHQTNNFLLLVNLFRPFDNAFVDLWNSARRVCNPNFVATLEKQSREVLPAYAGSDAQFAEFTRNQQWLKNLNWQISMASSNDMSFQYPVDVSRETIPMASAFPAQGTDWFKAGLIDKILSVSSSLADVLSLQPASRDPFVIGPREHLSQLLNLLALLRTGEQRFAPLLMTKVHDILPRLCNLMLPNAPENSAACNLNMNMDLFDGFGSAGIPQPPCAPIEDFSRAEDFKTEFKQEPGTSTSDGISSTSPFGNSPPILSPGGEYTQSLQTDFTPVTESVTSPLGAGPSPTLATPGGMNQQMSIPTMQALQMNQGLQGTPAVLNGQNLHQAQAQMLMAANGMMMRPQPQRSNSFALQARQIRTVGDFQALQRANSDMSTLNQLAMNSMGTEIDFNTLR